MFINVTWIKRFYSTFLSVYICKYKSIGGSYLEITTGPDSAWSETPLVETVCKGNGL